LFWSLSYLVLRRVLQLAALWFRSEEFKELEIVVLRHELAVLRLQVARPELGVTPSTMTFRGLVVSRAVGLGSGAREPAGEVALDAAQVCASAPVTDVTVGSHQVVRRPVDAERGERLPVDVVEDAGRGFAGQSMHNNEAAIAVAERGNLFAVPRLEGSAEEQVWEVGAARASCNQPGWLSRVMRASGRRSPAFGPRWSAGSPSWTAGLFR
jgi:hypothetical protein